MRALPTAPGALVVQTRADPHDEIILAAIVGEGKPSIRTSKTSTEMFESVLFQYLGVFSWQERGAAPCTQLVRRIQALAT